MRQLTTTVRAQFVRSAAGPKDFPKDELPEVALVGRSNVGKSSLLNRLLGVKGLAAVSKTPGRTQLVNFFRVNDRWYLVDLPGYGFAQVPERVRRRWQSLVTGYLFERAPLRLAILLVDARHDPMPIDLDVQELLARSGVPVAVVATKSDKLARGALLRQRAKLEEAFVWENSGRTLPLITFSAMTGEGRKELWNVIEKHACAAT